MKKNINLKKTEQIESVPEPLWGEFKQFFPLFSNIPYPFALCRVLIDKEGKPVDFIYVAVNKKNEEITSWKSQDMLGHRATEIYPKDSGFSNWISLLGKVALTGEHIRIEQYFPRVSSGILSLHSAQAKAILP